MLIRALTKEKHLRKDKFTKIVCHGNCSYCKGNTKGIKKQKQKELKFNNN